MSAVDERVAKLLAMSVEEYLRTMVVSAREAIMLPSVESAQAKVIVSVFEKMIDTAAGRREIGKALKRLNSSRPT